jgi:hypothetical protein
MVKKNEPLYKSRGLRSHLWISGPDPIDHAIHTAWARARAQAHFRNETWELTYEQYLHIWRPNWHLRGRAVDQLCMTRTDWTGAWCVQNVELVTRREALIRQAAERLVRNDAARAAGTYVKRRSNGYRRHAQ